MPVSRGFDNHPLAPLARSLRNMGDRNPITNPVAAAKMPAAVQGHIAAIANTPELAAMANGTSAGPGTGGSGSSFAQGQDMVAANQNHFRRLPDVRHNIVGAAPLVFAGAGTAKLIFVPQTRFKGNRLVIPSNTLAGTLLSNVLVGTRPQSAAFSAEPVHMFEETATSGVWDLDVCEIGQQITGNIAVTGATTVFAAIIGEALDGKPYPMLRSPLKRASQVTLVAAGATVNVQISPQVRFKTRKLVCDDATAGSFTINSFTVGISPQFMSGDPVPALAFSELAQDVWLDCDEAYIGNAITFNVTNTSGGALNFGVSLLGDVDPRDLQSAYGYY